MAIFTERIIKHPILNDLGYPETEIRPRSEDWHGTKIIDDYAWLEGNDEKVKSWEAKQNQLTRTYLDSLDYRTDIKNGLKKWFDLDQVGCPFPRGEKLFQWKRKAGENHYVLYVGKDLDNQSV